MPSRPVIPEVLRGLTLFRAALAGLLVTPTRPVGTDANDARMEAESFPSVQDLERVLPGLGWRLKAAAPAGSMTKERCWQPPSGAAYMWLDHNHEKADYWMEVRPQVMADVADRTPDFRGWRIMRLLAEVSAWEQKNAAWVAKETEKALKEPTDPAGEQDGGAVTSDSEQKPGESSKSRGEQGTTGDLDTDKLQPLRKAEAVGEPVFKVTLNSHKNPVGPAMKVVRDANGMSYDQTTALLAKLPAVVKGGLTQVKAQKLQADLAAKGAEATIAIDDGK